MAQQFGEFLDELRARVHIEELVGEYVQLKPKGRRFWGLCPFHQEKSPSFSVDAESQLFYCFGCHKGGTAFNFVMEMERMEFIDAVKLLADRVGMALPDRPGGERRADSARLRERIFEANRAAAMDFHARIWTAEGAKALDYLYRRGLNDSDIRRFGLGVSAPGWDDLCKALTAAGFEREVLEKAGLVVVKDRGPFDMFRDRVMFPILSQQGRVIGFGARALGDAQPKYLNTQETTVFNKRLNLYGLNWLKKERNIGHTILVEGYMDAVSLRRSGVPGVVATLGTALTTEQASLIKRFAPEVYISYDGDSAGQKATLRALDILEAQEVRARVLLYPDGMDPDDFIRERGAEAFHALPPMDAYEFRLLRAQDGLDLNTQDGRTQYALAACEILRRVKNPVELENYVALLARRTGFEREILYRQIGAPPAKSERVRGKRLSGRRELEADYVVAERRLIALFAARLLPEGMLAATDFSDPLYLAMYQKIAAGASPGALVDELSPEDRQRALDALHYEPFPETEEIARGEAGDCINCIRRHRLEAQIDALRSSLSGMPPGGERREMSERLNGLLAELERF